MLSRLIPAISSCWSYGSLFSGKMILFWEIIFFKNSFLTDNFYADWAEFWIKVEETACWVLVNLKNIFGLESVRQTSQIIKIRFAYGLSCFFMFFSDQLFSGYSCSIWLDRCAIRIAYFGGQSFYGSIQNKRGPFEIPCVTSDCCTLGLSIGVSEVFRKNKKGGCYHPRW